jgi:hypothetical protein
LENISTETLIDELMRRSPDIQRKLILDSINQTGPPPTSSEPVQTTEDTMINSSTVNPESDKQDNVSEIKTPAIESSHHNQQTTSMTYQPNVTEKPVSVMKPDAPIYTFEDIDVAVSSKTMNYLDTPKTVNKKHFNGLNEPRKYKPTIEIEPPIMDPEVPKKKNRTEVTEYNPEKPAITTRDRIKCKECRRSFGNQGSYSRHYRSHHMDKEFQCGECGSTFRRKDSLQHHYQTKHRTTTPQEDLKPIPKISFNIKPKYSIKDLDLPGTISPKLLSKLKNTIKEHSN